MIEQHFKSLDILFSNDVFSLALKRLAEQRPVEVVEAVRVWSRISERINSAMLGVNYPKNPEDINFFMYGIIVGVITGLLGMAVSKNGKDIDILKYYVSWVGGAGAVIDLLEELTNSSAMNVTTFIPRLLRLFG